MSFVQKKEDKLFNHLNNDELKRMFLPYLDVLDVDNIVLEKFEEISNKLPSIFLKIEFMTWIYNNSIIGGNLHREADYLIHTKAYISQEGFENLSDYFLISNSLVDKESKLKQDNLINLFYSLNGCTQPSQKIKFLNIIFNESRDVNLKKFVLEECIDSKLYEELISEIRKEIQPLRLTII